jgi:hypothetical protein
MKSQEPVYFIYWPISEIAQQWETKMAIDIFVKESSLRGPESLKILRIVRDSTCNKIVTIF